MISFTVATGILSKAVSVRHQGLVTGVISGIRQQGNFSFAFLLLAFLVFASD